MKFKCNKFSLTLIFLLLLPMQAGATLFCKNKYTGVVSANPYTNTCPSDNFKVTESFYCAHIDQASLSFEKFCSLEAFNDNKLCNVLINKDGTVNYKKEEATNEATNRNLSLEDCKMLTGRYTNEEKAYIKKELEIAQKKERINQLKSDCNDIGFTDGTEAMGNCVLKMMEIESKSFSTSATSTNSSIDNEIVNIERQKLEAQRESLKVQQDQLKAEQALADQIRRDAIKRQADRSIKQGFCLLNGGGWGCGY